MNDQAPSLRPLFLDHSTDIGGAEFALARLLRTEQEWDPSLVVPPSADPETDAFHSLPARVHVERVGPRHSSLTTDRSRFAVLALGWRLAQSAWSVWNSKARRRSDVLIANTTRASVYVTAVGILSRQPVVVHIRDMVEPEALGGTATRLMRKFVLPRAAGVIANSRTALAKVAPFLDAACVTAVIPSPSGLIPVAPDEVTASPHVRTIGIVARLDPWKGQHLLIRAFARALPDSPTRLVLIGGAAFGHDAYLDQIHVLAAELGVADRVDFVGHVDDVPAAIADLDICVQCSTRAEPLGQNVLQYLAAGKPTIVADEGGPSEWVADNVNGLTFAARDDQSLADALRRMTDDAELRARLAAAAASTPGLLTDDQVGAEIVEVLRKVQL